MTVVAYRPDVAAFETHLLPLLRRFYPDLGNDAFFRHGYEAAFRYCLHNEHVELLPLALRRAGDLAGHVALIRDDRLGSGEAFFGFLEVVNDTAAFDDLWRALKGVARAKGIRRLKGPVNGSIWHQYRCVKESSPTPRFRTEPRTPLHHYRLLKGAGPSKEIAYSSGVRHSYARMLALMESKADEIARDMRSYDVELSVERAVSARTLREIVSTSDQVFGGRSWGYTPLSSEEFLDLYRGMAGSRYFHRAFLLRRAGRLIGYAITLRDGRNMICKTICLLPSYQNRGLGNALALHLHLVARQDGMSSIMYVLVRDDNRIRDFPMEDIEIFRRYAAFDYDI